MKITIGYLYPTIMSQYGDRGNLSCLLKRCAWRGIEAEVLELGLGASVNPDQIDLFLMGGGADTHQKLVARDLVEVKGPGIREAVENGAAALLVCAGYQLFGHYYRPYHGDDLLGLGIFDAYTIHQAARIGARLSNITEAGRVRLVGNVVVRWGGHTLVGFENHGGRTYLNPGAFSLGKVVFGGGNNGEDGFEGSVYKSAIGTYLHGPVLPKNPSLADHLIKAALSRRYAGVELSPLDDSLESAAHREAVSRAHEVSGERIDKSHSRARKRSS